MTAGLRQAVGFLTPLGGARPPTPAAVAWFPVVGLGMGLALGGVWSAGDRVWAPAVAAAVVVAADLALTGLLHLDGLVDSADGLLPHMSSPERRLEVMRRPDAGAFGVGVAGAVLLLRWSALATIVPSALLLAALWCLSRTAMALAALRLTYARAGGGLASAFLPAPPRPSRRPRRRRRRRGAPARPAPCRGVHRGRPRRRGPRRRDMRARRRRRFLVRSRSLAAAGGILADQLFGEPPIRPHPVSSFGRLMRSVERHLHRDRRIAGVAHAGIGVAVAAAAGRAVRSTAAATYLAVAGRALGEAAGGVAGALRDGDLEAARGLLPALVGRDASALDEKAICRAAVESVAENTVDAVVAPALWAAALGAPGAFAYRAANTLDAMVGHRSERYLRYGWASARLDDAANLGPARVTAALVAAVRPPAARAVWSTVRRDAPAHPSPNSGVAEAAFAAALGLRLGGESTYGGRAETRPPLGAGRPPEVADIGRAVDLSRHVALALAGALAVHGLSS